MSPDFLHRRENEACPVLQMETKKARWEKCPAQSHTAGLRQSQNENCSPVPGHSTQPGQWLDPELWSLLMALQSPSLGSSGSGEGTLNSGDCRKQKL